MSIDALSWAFNLDLPSSGVKLTLLALANYADENGEAFPSQKAMAIKTCLCERAIRTHLATLEALGLISRISRTRANGSFTSDLFTLNINQRQIMPAAKSADGKNSTSQRQIFPNPAAESAGPDPSLNTTITKSNLLLTAKEKRGPKKKTQLPAIFEPTDKHRDFANLNGLQIATELEKFRFHHEAKETLSGNWNSSFSTWLHNAVEFSRKRAPPPNVQSARLDTLNQIWGNQNGNDRPIREINERPAIAGDFQSLPKALNGIR